MTGWSAITWETARAGGFASYALLTLAVSFGLVLGNRWQSSRWPRLVTNEVHGYVSLLALVFIAIHVAAVAVDPFTRFGLGELIVPMTSHYRTLWMGLGIVALYLLLAVWVTSKLRNRIAYTLWRRVHVLAFAVYAAATLHGLGTGSDSRTVWAMALYATSAALVGTLLAIRLVAPAGSTAQPRPWLAALAGLGLLGAVAWTMAGPLAPGWSLRAGGRQPVAQSRVLAAAPRHTLSPPSLASAVVRPPFTAAFRGHLTEQPIDGAGRVTVRIDGALSGATADHLELLIHGVPVDGGGVAMEQSRVRMGTTTAFYVGQIVALRGTEIRVVLHSPRQRVLLGMQLQIADDGTVDGTVRATAGAARSTA